MAGLLSNDNPNLPLQATPLDTASGINNAANLMQSDKSAGLAQQLMRGNIAMQPAQLQQIQAQTGLIGAETANQNEALVKAQFDNMNDKAQQQAAAAIRFATMIKPAVDSGDLSTINAIANSAANDPLYGPAGKEVLNQLKGATAVPPALKGLVDAHVQAGQTLGIIPNTNQVVSQGGYVVNRAGNTINDGTDGAFGAIPQAQGTTTAPAAGQQAPAAQPTGAPSGSPPPLPTTQAPAVPAGQQVTPQQLLQQPAQQGQNQVSPTDQLPLTSETPQSIAAKYPGLHGSAYLATLRPDIAAQVQAYSEGRIIFPTSNSERTPFMRAVVGAALQYNPGLDATTMQTRQAMRTSMANGDFGSNVSALNMGMSHMGTYLDAYNGIDNGSFPTENTAGNWLAEKGVGPNATALQGALSSTQTAATALKGEMAKNFKSSGATDQEIENWNQHFADNAPPAETGGALGTGITLLDGRMNALATQYNRALGTNITGWQLLSPEAQKAYIKVKQQVPQLLQNTLPTSGAQGATAAPAGAAQGAGGWKYIGKVNQ